MPPRSGGPFRGALLVNHIFESNGCLIFASVRWDCQSGVNAQFLTAIRNTRVRGDDVSLRISPAVICGSFQSWGGEGSWLLESWRLVYARGRLVVRSLRKAFRVSASRLRTADG
jgi:hypothetical protein